MSQPTPTRFFLVAVGLIISLAAVLLLRRPPKMAGDRSRRISARADIQWRNSVALIAMVW